MNVRLLTNVIINSFKCTKNEVNENECNDETACNCQPETNKDVKRASDLFRSGRMTKQ